MPNIDLKQRVTFSLSAIIFINKFGMTVYVNSPMCNVLLGKRDQEEENKKSPSCITTKRGIKFLVVLMRAADCQPKGMNVEVLA